MSRPTIRRALKRAHLPRAGEARERGSAGQAPPPRVFLEGEVPDPTENPAPLDLAAFFGQEAPVELEIGVGKGRFLISEAEAHPERNYLGLELARDYARLARGPAERRGLANVRIEALDGKAFVEKRLAEGSLAALHIFFPDPWPKKRHRKRRLVDPAFAAAAARALAPGAALRVASDHAEYYEAIQAALDSEPLLRGVPEGEAATWSAGTNYEAKFLERGRAIRKGVWRRR